MGFTKGRLARRAPEIVNVREFATQQHRELGCDQRKRHHSFSERFGEDAGYDGNPEGLHWARSTDNQPKDRTDDQNESFVSVYRQLLS